MEKSYDDMFFNGPATPGGYSRTKESVVYEIHIVCDSGNYEPCGGTDKLYFTQRTSSEEDARESLKKFRKSRIYCGNRDNYSILSARLERVTTTLLGEFG